MANRFLDTNYYKSPFVRSLKGPLKSLYSYIICDCDGAGIWHLDLEVASLYIGFPISDEEFKKDFVDRGKAIPVGQNRYFFPDFIEHQYPQGLIETNPAHKNFISRLKKFELIDEKLNFIDKKKQGAQKGLERPLGNGNVLGNVLGNGNCTNLEECEKPFSKVAIVGAAQNVADLAKKAHLKKRSYKSKETELNDRIFGYWTSWYRKRNNNTSPKTNSRSGKAVKEIYKHFLREGRHKGAPEDQIYNYAFNEFSAILDQWERLSTNKFLYSCVDIVKISGNITDIINHLNRSNGRHTASVVGKTIDFDKP